ncbi:hypothetical protein N9212_01520 [Luminiphilus sp.]|jgi:hypothetical protein|nr:hypothetical protein [Luminiphilus sp.]
MFFRHCFVDVRLTRPLAPYKVLKTIHSLDSIPLTSVGKIDKKHRQWVTSIIEEILDGYYVFHALYPQLKRHHLGVVDEP